MAEVKSNPVIDAVTAQAQATAQRTSDAITISDIMDKATALIGDQGENLDNLLSAQKIQSANTNAFKAQTDARSAQALEINKSDPLAAGNRLVQLAMDRENAYNSAKMAEEEVHRQKLIDPMDDPLGWISAQFTLPSAAETYNHFVTVHNNAAHEYDGVIASTTQTGHMNKAVEQTTSAAMAKADLDALEATAQVNKTKLQQDNLHLNLQSVGQLSQLHAQEFAQVMSVAQLQALEEQRAWMREQRRNARADKEDKEAAAKEDLSDYNTGAARVGAPQISDPKKVQKLLNAKSPTVLKLVGLGQDITLAGAPDGIPVARSSGEAASLLVETSARPSGTMAGVQQFLTDMYSAAKQNPAANKDPSGFQSELTNQLKGAAQKQLGAIRFDDSNNIYAAQTPAAILQTKPSLLTDPFIKAVIEPMAKAAPTAPVSPEVIVGQAVAMLNKDNFNDVARGITTYFRSAVDVNNATRGYKEYGLPEQTNYKATTKMGTLFGGTFGVQQVDFSDITSVKRLLMSEQNKLQMATTGRVTPLQ